MRLRRDFFCSLPAFDSSRPSHTLFKFLIRPLEHLDFGVGRGMNGRKCLLGNVPLFLKVWSEIF